MIRLIHTLKIYYYIVSPKQITSSNSITTTAPYKVYQYDDKSGEQRLDRASIVHIRAYILNLLNKLMFTLPAGCTDEKDLNREEEFQAIFNYISTVNEVSFSRKIFKFL